MVGGLVIGFAALVISFTVPGIDPNLGLWIACICWLGPVLAMIILDYQSKKKVQPESSSTKEDKIASES